MKRLLLVAALLLILASCKEKIEDQERIMIRNNTGFDLKIGIVPQKPYRFGVGYRPSTNGGGSRDLEFIVGTAADADIFVSSDVTGSPHELAKEVLEQMTITLQNDMETRIKFIHDSATNYRVNIFSEQASWVYEQNDLAMPTQFKRNPVESHDYYFVINEEDIIKK